ncbi:MAG: hypothetical protein RIE32_07720 [Phycisphaerales bacterium]
MALNKERKVLLGLLGSAGLILAIDQLLLSPPSGAQASNANPTVPTPADSVPASSSDTSTPVSTGTGLSEQAARQWNEKLHAALDEHEVTPDLDPFTEVVHSADDAGEAGPMSVEAFLSQHQLSLVLLSGDTSVAMVNGKPVRLGEEIEGYRLIRVDSRSAVFQSGTQTAELSLPKQTSGGTP